MGDGPPGRLPISESYLVDRPSGSLFGLTQNAGMGWPADQALKPSFLIVSTQGGIPNGPLAPEALGYHTGHWQLLQLVRAAALELRTLGAIPFAAFCTDPCDGRTQGTPGMMDSLAYRNDAAIVVRRLIRSLPDRRGVIAVAGCDKGLPAMMMALAGCGDLPGIVVPGGVTLPARHAEDAGKVQSLGARFADGRISLEYAAEMACRACGSSGGGCQFLGTAASAQVTAEALGIALPHSALAPSGEAVWEAMARSSARAVRRMADTGVGLSGVLSAASIHNAMLLHAAFGGSTNMLLHIPAVAHAAGLPVPGIEDWKAVNRAVPRLVDALPNGPRNHPTVQVFLAGGVPEVMLHLRRLGLLDGRVPTVAGCSLDEVLDWWADSARRRESRKRLREAAAVDPDEVILSPDRARQAGLTATVVFPSGNLLPEGSVVKATAIDPERLDADRIFRHQGPARVFVSESEAVRAIKAGELNPGDVLVLIGLGPFGTGFEEIYQVTSALKHLPWGREIAVLTDGRFSGVSTGPCIGHAGPEALAGGPIGRLRDGDIIEIRIDAQRLEGSVDFTGTVERRLSPAAAATELERRPPHPGLRSHPCLPADTRLWACLQGISGGIWGGAVYDSEKIVARIEGRD